MKKLVLVLVLSLGVIACEDNQGVITEQSLCTTLETSYDNVIIGGSITEGHPGRHGANDGECENKPGQLSYYIEQDFGSTVNMGIGGQSCKQILERFHSQVITYSPKKVFMNCGHNKLSTEMLDVYDEVVELSNLYNFELVILNVSKDYRKPQKTELIKEINIELDRLSSPTVTVLDFFTWSESNPSQIIDGIHPSRAGYEHLYNNVIK